MVAEPSDATNLVEEFEEAFQSCLNVLTKQEAGPCVEKEEVKVEVDRFIDLARQMEAFFLQKRFLLSALKPELIVKEDNNELRLELGRKEELLARHHEKIAQWQNLLADMQGYAKGSTAVPSTSSQQQPDGTPPSSTTPQPSQQQQQHPQHPMQQQQQQMQHSAAIAAQVQQLQQQVLQRQQQQQHAAAMQQQMAAGGVPPGMYLQQGPHGGFPQPGSLQGPLAYLEKTTTNIDLVGMGDGRR